MTDQLTLLGIEPVGEPRHRLFFAIFPDTETAARIAILAQQLREKHGLKGKPLKTERFHVTLHHLGDYAELPQGIIDRAQQAGSAVAMQAFELAFDHAASFASMPRNRPFVLRANEGATALMQFQQALGLAMKTAMLGAWVKASYTPHVTLLYDDRGVAAQDIDTIRWTAREFVLVHSLLGENRHIRLASWPLREVSV